MSINRACIRSLITCHSIIGQHLLLYGIWLLATLALATPATAATIDEQRSQFQQARKAIKAGNTEKFLRLAAGLKDYPLYPYLRYEYVRRHLKSLPDSDVAAFLKQHPDFPMADKLRNKWLDILASRGRWQKYIDHYVQPNDNRLRCLYLVARMKAGQKTESLLEDIRTMWLVGYSQHDACDPAFDRLEASSLMTNELIWERIRLAMENHKPGLVNYLSRKLEGPERNLANQWLEMHRNPDAGTRNPTIADTPQGRKVILHGLKRLANRNIDRALDRWSRLKNDYDFLSSERKRMERDLAVIAAGQDHDRTMELLDRVAGTEIDPTVFIYQLRNAIDTENWAKLREWTEGAPPDNVDSAQWRYWHARALAHTGDPKAARDIYHELAAERDFYGFLAADRLNVSYQMNNFPMPISQEQREQIAQMPSMRRAFEFLVLGEEYAARREWHHALTHMTSHQMQVAASLAAARGWHDRAILALGKAKAYDDLETRFPLIHHSTLEQYANKHDLDLSWVYGVIRTESAFWEDARSPAGALGLMQVMPRTGQETARQLGMKNFNTSALLKAEHNIPIGSRYLKRMYDKFQGNMILATAAYNAGPHRVKSWLPKSGCMEPDVWIENIPFHETRNYVKRVLSYTSIYDWRLQGEIKPLSTRMAHVQPLQKKGGMLAGLSCSATTISLNE